MISKSKTVYEVVQNYIKERSQYENVIEELMNLKKLRSIGMIDSDELKRRQTLCLERFFAIDSSNSKKNKITNWRYYSIFDTTMNELLETGRNSNSLEGAVEDGIEFVGIEFEDEDWKQVNGMSLKEKAEFLATHNYTIVGHNMKAEKAVDGVDFARV